MNCSSSALLVVGGTSAKDQVDALQKGVGIVYRNINFIGLPNNLNKWY